jgi:hypothetical protein
MNIAKNVIADQLDGVDLVDGERLRVTFPNEETIDITVSLWCGMLSKPTGEVISVFTKRAYLSTKWKAHPCMVALVGLKAIRLKK